MKFLLKYHKHLAIICVLICVLISILQSYKINLGIITNYGADFFCPILLYYFFRMRKDDFSKLYKRQFTSIQVSIGLFILCVAWELRQLYNSQKYGTFDLIDFFVYFIAILICYIIDEKIKEFLKRHNSQHRI